MTNTWLVLESGHDLPPSIASLHRVPVLVDTSVLVASANRHDHINVYAQQVWHKIQAERCRPFTTNILVIEAHTLLLIRVQHTVTRS